MYQNILVAVDGSDTSNIALQQAINLAQDQHAKLRIAHVVDLVTFNWDETYLVDINDLQESFLKSGRNILEKAQSIANEAGMKAETRLLEIETFRHRVADLIVEEAKSWPADLIVVGTHGRRGLHHLFLGSVAEGIVRGATVPVLLIRGT